MAELVSVRLAVLGDFPTIEILWASVNQAHVEAHPEQLRQVESGFVLKRFTDLLASETSRTFVAEREGEIVGMIAVTSRDVPPSPALLMRRTLYVDILAVDSRVRRQGIGHLLMERVIAWGQEKGIVELELDVFDFNASAIAFYEVLGIKTKIRRMTLPL